MITILFAGVVQQPRRLPWKGLIPSLDLNGTPLAAFLLICRAQRGWDRNLSLGVRWVPHKNVSQPNHSTSATILPTCYASTESLGVSELNDINIISFSVSERISQAVESTNFTTIVFTLPHIMAPKFANQLPIRNVRRTCNPHKIRWDFFCIMEKHQNFWLADLRIHVSDFTNCYANATDHMTKSDLKIKSQTAVVIMTWLLQGIPFICWNVGTYKHLWIPQSSHESH